MRSLTIARAGDPFPGSAFASPIYRIPALCVTQSGRILLAYDVREDWRDLPADFDIAVRHSDDGGKTWSAPRALRRHEPGHGFGDASLTCASISGGDILCWYVGSTGESYFSAKPGAPGLDLWLARSRDNGLTWEHEQVDGLRPAGVGGMFASSGNGLALTDGGLVQTFVARVDDSNYALAARSDDSGKTWRAGSLIGPDCDENKVVELTNGDILMHARAAPARRQAVSPDGLTFTEPTPVPTLTDPACNGGLCRWGDTLVASMCDHPEERGRLCLHLSDDDGITWGPAVSIDTGATAYSVLAPVDDDTLAIAWEADDYRTIQFARITCGETITPRVGEGQWAKPPVVNPSGK
ncbi:exo-alpha-sialidase [Corynebacterium sp. HMSC073D01]|uniref:sialidase family protein n=1 Tax=Corynebacterium sp. HMSC073D01 TaxID=1739536 RepID=UPI0008A30819|nr:sialidase family protein [Corynebacterium sp. HMSC073D01]OFO45775.1 sialidase [Corynebacterium sp. HMSC073D01]